MHLLDKQNEAKICLKRAKLSASGVSKIFLKQECFTYPLADNFTYFKQKVLNLVYFPLETRQIILCHFVYQVNAS